MKKIFSILLLSLVCITASAQIERPKIVVGFVVDQMRWDYLYYYYDKFGNGGLKRLIDEGFSCENNMINYLPTVTAIGHASVYTGTTPALHGIAGNNFYKDGVSTYCCADSTVRGVGTESKAGKMSPRNMQAPTIGDMLRTSNDFRSRVFGVALKDRAAILPAGHSANAAYWYDNSVGHFITSTYYMDKLPEWVVKFNEKNATPPKKDMKMVKEGITLTFKMAEALLDNEKIGKGDVTDMLCVSISSTDAMAHEYGTRGKLIEDAYLQLDKDLAHFFDKLDKEFGRNNYLFFLTADHGGMHNVNFLKEHKIPAYCYNEKPNIEKIKARLQSKLGISPDVVVGASSCRYYFNHQLIKERNLDFEAIKREAMDVLMEDSLAAFVIDFAKAGSSTVPQPIRERIINSYHPHRSGDLIVIPINYTVNRQVPVGSTATTHSMWNPYDAHIPLVFMGWHIKSGSTSTPTRIVDIAPTVCAMLHIQMPDGTIGDAILPVVE